MADQQNFFGDRSLTLQLADQMTAASPPGVSALENFRRFFNFSSVATISAVCLARKNGLAKIRLEIALQPFHRGGDFAELPPAFGRERTVGIVFKSSRAAFDGQAVAQQVNFHEAKIHLTLPGAPSSKCNIFNFGFRRAVAYFDRTMEAVRRAVIDVGTNSIKLLVADVRGREVHARPRGEPADAAGQGLLRNAPAPAGNHRAHRRGRLGIRRNRPRKKFRLHPRHRHQRRPRRDEPDRPDRLHRARVRFENGNHLRRPRGRLGVSRRDDGRGAGETAAACCSTSAAAARNSFWATAKKNLSPTAFRSARCG